MLEALPYFLFLGITILIFSLNSQKGKKISPFTVTTFLIMTLFAGLRSPFVGTDTYSYIRAYNQIGNRTLEGSFVDKLLDEPGYYYLQQITHFFSDKSYAVLIVVSCLFSFFVLRSIINYSKNRVFSLFVFITLGYYTFCFNAARQALALSIYLMALPCILDRNFVRYVIIVGIAALFHKTVLITIPLYFIFRLPFSWKSVTVTVIIGILLSLDLPTLLSSASTLEHRYALYANEHATGGYLLTVFYTALAIFFITIRNRVPVGPKKHYDMYLQMLICGSMIYLIVSLTKSYVELTRFAAYFQVSSIFLFSILYNSKTKIINGIMLYSICVGCLIFFYIFVTTMAGLTPYSLNPEL